MVEVKFDKKTKKFSIVDESEGTIGASRQITRFKQHCLPKIEKQKEALSDFKFVEEYDFKFVSFTDGVNYTKLFFESTEN